MGDLYRRPTNKSAIDPAPRGSICRPHEGHSLQSPPNPIAQERSTSPRLPPGRSGCLLSITTRNLPSTDSTSPRGRRTVMHRKTKIHRALGLAFGGGMLLAAHQSMAQQQLERVEI